MTAIAHDFENHANRIAAGFRAMSPAPERQPFNPNHHKPQCRTRS